MNRTPDGGKKEHGKGKTSALEWVMAGLSGLVLLLVLAFLVNEGLNGGDSPPRITIEVDSILDTGGGYLVEFHAVNGGDETAAGVVVEGRVTGGDGEEETSTSTVDFVPANSRRAGGLLFRADPRTGALEIRARGYARP